MAASNRMVHVASVARSQAARTYSRLAATALEPTAAEQIQDRSAAQ